jgi:hypothetical protein
METVADELDSKREGFLLEELITLERLDGNQRDDSNRNVPPPSASNSHDVDLPHPNLDGDTLTDISHPSSPPARQPNPLSLHPSASH